MNTIVIHCDTEELALTLLERLANTDVYAIRPDDGCQTTGVRPIIIDMNTVWDTDLFFETLTAYCKDTES